MKLWTAQTISVFGSTISREALPLVAILTLASSPAQVGLLAALGAIPTLVLGLPAGQALAVAMLTVGQLVGDTALTVYMIDEVSLRQAVTPNHLLGRITPALNFW